jgi:hypothetical protein
MTNSELGYIGIGVLVMVVMGWFILSVAPTVSSTLVII